MSRWHTDLGADLAGSDDVSGTLTVRVGPVACLATLPAVTCRVPAGEWRVTASLTARPDATAPPPATTEHIAVLATAGVVTTEPLTLRLYRSLDGPAAATCSVRVEKRSAEGWAPYGEGATAEVPLPAVEPCAHLPRWGANLHIYLPGDRPPGTLDPFLHRMATIGMGLVRTSIPWNLLCPDGDAFDDFALVQADAFFAGCERSGVRAIPIVDADSPRWAQGDRPNVPASWDAYSAFVGRCLDRWGHTFTAVVTQNEPNHEGHVDEFDPETVVAAARAARAGLVSHPRWSRLPLLGPGIAYGDGPYLGRLLDAGLGDVVDGIACHPYAVRFDGGVPEFRRPDRPWGDPAGDPNHLVSGVEAVWETLQARGYDLPIWVNEFGLSTSLTGPEGTRSGLDVTEEEQAEWLAIAFRQVAAIPYVESFCVYMLHDNPWPTLDTTFDDFDPNDRTWHSCFGLLSWDGAHEKPSFRAVVDAIAAAAAAAGAASTPG